MDQRCRALYPIQKFPFLKNVFQTPIYPLPTQSPISIQEVAGLSEACTRHNTSEISFPAAQL